MDLSPAGRAGTGAAARGPTVTGLVVWMMTNHPVMRVVLVMLLYVGVGGILGKMFMEWFLGWFHDHRP